MRYAPRLSEQSHDIQGMLKSGFGSLTTSRFRLLTILDERLAKAWLARLLDTGLVASAEQVGKPKQEKQQKERLDAVVAIGFTYSGLTKLGCRETSEHPFPTPFRSGMGSELRAKLLRDEYRQWTWTDREGPGGGEVVHILLAEWKTRGAASRLPAIDPHAFSVIEVGEESDFFDGDGKLREPFGFRDGLAQPVIRGLRDQDGESLKQAREGARDLYDDRVVEPGEFILGYRNEYDELTFCPNVEGWTSASGQFTLNGSYLAVRQFEQDVAAFEAFEAAHTDFAAANGVSAGEKLMGRRKNGLPLSWKGDPAVPVSDSVADAFRYRVEDANGFMCPNGAHVRRSNPRDSLGIDVQSSIKSSKLHRLLRRGRPYREKSGRQGIFFIACNADLERQFEFIHQRWLQNRKFGALESQDDPIVGSQPCPKAFTIPGQPSGGEVSLQRFTQTLGGGYFFLPGITALNFIARA
ncbi:Dyp-type peroxidase domain-containing protein [Bradyrhizobium sp. LVM 105]|uniref:Dyp-type peroxidase n=1 Tax=Bradyrhizobium sp. LVM 105 TaxID=2341115 RepID=UPI001FE0E283|nr:Dyp-type peroxidase domain-containing protein [Bradyrhizobium sp. LVM 105]